MDSRKIPVVNLESASSIVETFAEVEATVHQIFSMFYVLFRALPPGKSQSVAQC